MEIEVFSYRPINTIDLNFYDCSISLLQAQGPQMEALEKWCLIIPARVQSGTKVFSHLHIVVQQKTCKKQDTAAQNLHPFTLPGHNSILSHLQISCKIQAPISGILCFENLLSFLMPVTQTKIQFQSNQLSWSIVIIRYRPMHVLQSSRIMGIQEKQK